MLSEHAAAALCLERQCLSKPADATEYDALFRDMAPVPTEYWCMPGDPPWLYFRSTFDDKAYNQARRSDRTIIKGRFQGGGVAYIEQEQLPLFAALYRKNIKMDYDLARMLELVEREGPVTIGILKEMTGLPAKRITPLLHKLQQAFLVYEDQVDGDWERGWYAMGQVFDVDLHQYNRQEALEQVLPRFAYRFGAFRADMAKAFYRLPGKEIGKALQSLEAQGILAADELHGEPVWLHPADRENLTQERNPPQCVYVLHRGDFLVRACEPEIKAKFKPQAHDVLQYILVDGVFHGAVTGDFKQGPSVVEDVVLDLPETQCRARREEVLAAVRRVNDPVLSPVKRYCSRSVL